MRQTECSLVIKDRCIAGSPHSSYNRARTVAWANQARICKAGPVSMDVGGASVVVGRDGERMDRDYNGARGIYLRALGDIPALRALFSECAASANDSCLSGNMSEDAQVSLLGSS